MCVSEWDGLVSVQKKVLTSVSDSLLLDGLCSSEAGGVKSLIALHVSHGDDELSAGGLGQALEVLLVAAAGSNGPSLDEVLEAKVVDSLRGKDDIGSCVNDLLDTLLGDVHLALADPLNLRRVKR